MICCVGELGHCQSVSRWPRDNSAGRVPAKRMKHRGGKRLGNLPRPPNANHHAPPEHCRTLSLSSYPSAHLLYPFARGRRRSHRARVFLQPSRSTSAMLMMLAPSLLLYVSLLLDHLPAADALRVPISGRRVSRTQDRIDHIRRGLGRRAAMEGDLQDQSDVRYYTNVSLGGQQFSVLVDTGR